MHPLRRYNLNFSTKVLTKESKTQMKKTKFQKRSLTLRCASSTTQPRCLNNKYVNIYRKNQQIQWMNRMPVSTMINISTTLRIKKWIYYKIVPKLPKSNPSCRTKVAQPIAKVKRQKNSTVVNLILQCYEKHIDQPSECIIYKICILLIVEYKICLNLLLPDMTTN